MKKSVLIMLVFLISGSLFSQSNYEIKINLKNCKDTIAFLTFYQFDKNMIKDTCTNIKNGKIVFKGKGKLEKGVYSLVSQKKSIYFDFIVDDQNQFIEIESDEIENFSKGLVSKNSEMQNNFFNYIKYLNSQGAEFEKAFEKTKGMKKADSVALVTAKQKIFQQNVAQFEEKFYELNKANFVGDVLNLKMEKVLKTIPKATNGRPDSLVAYNYYKNHYWDNVNFKDDAICRTPFFANKLKRYFEDIVVKHPDSISVEIDRILDKTNQSSLVNKLLIAHFTYNYETSKVMGFDRVFVHIVDKYFRTGKANGIYEHDDVVKNLIDKANKLSPLLMGKRAPDLAMIAAENRDKIKKMGFEDVKSSQEATNLFYSNINEIEKTFLKLYSINAQYTLLVFWDVDCSHCQAEIPKVLEVYHELKAQNKDVKVFSVYTQREYDKYIKYIKEKNLDWINVYDGVHYNNLSVKYDIVSTPVFYLLDKDKVIRAKNFSASHIKEIIKAVDAEDVEKRKVK